MGETNHKKRKHNSLLTVDINNTTNNYDVFSKEVLQSTTKSITATAPPTGQAIIKVIKDTFGSTYNILHYAGGPGAYLILGPSEAGKTTLIKSLYMTSQLFSQNYGILPCVWTTLLVFSGTSELTKDLEWAEDIMVRKPLDEEYIKAAIEERKAEMQEGAETQSLESGESISPEEWAKDNPMAIIVDDWNGIINATRPGNFISALTTVVRKYGIYLFLLAQGFNQCGPTIKDNIRVILTVQLNNAHTKVLLDRMFGKMYPSEQLANHNMKRYHVNMYVRQWLLSLPEYGSISPTIISLPPFPMYPNRKVMTREEFLDALEKAVAEEEAENEVSDDENNATNNPNPHLPTTFLTPGNNYSEIKVKIEEPQSLIDIDALTRV